MSGSIIAGGARTPIGKLLGSLKDFQAVDLGASRSRPRWRRPACRPRRSTT